MRRIWKGQPSSAVAVVVLALVAAVAGSAIAQDPVATTSAKKLTKKQKKQVKKISKKQANKQIAEKESGLSVSHAETADSATTASNVEPPEPFRLLGAGEFQNGWVARGGGASTPGYYKDQLGVVHLRGQFKDGTSSNNSAGDMFTLPSGYRPAESQQFQGGDATGSGNIAVLSSGAVRALSGAGNLVLSVDGFTFRAGD